MKKHSKLILSVDSCRTLLKKLLFSLSFKLSCLVIPFLY